MNTVFDLDGVDYIVAETREEAIRLWSKTYGMTPEENGNTPDDFVETDPQRVLTITMEDGPEDYKETHTIAEWAQISRPGLLCSTEW